MTLDSFVNSKKLTPKFKSGQIVDARNRLWRIERIISQKSEFDRNSEINLLEVSSIDGVPNRCCLLLNTVKKINGNVEVKSLEDIKLAKIPKPDVNKLGNPDFQKVLIQAMRFDLIFGTSSFISLANSRVIPVSYQLVPVLMAMAQEKVRLLLADDVGLGKTIEAGLIIQELLGRKKINRVLFVVPANLREQWKLIMQRFFGLDVHIISRQTRRRLEKELLVGGDPWGYFNFLITSQDYLSRQEILERATQFNFDMVVIDEAHNVAKPRYMMQRKGSKKSKRAYIMAERLAKYPNLLLLTATPHNGYHESFASIIYLLNSKLVDEKHDWSIDREIATRYICQRRKKDVKNWMEGKEMETLFPKVHRKEVFIDPSPEFKHVISFIDEYAKIIYDTAKKDTSGVRFIKYWAILHMYRRLISSPYALIKTIQNKIKDDSTTEKELIDVKTLPEDEIQEHLERTRQNVTDIDIDESFEEHEIDRNNDSEFGRQKLSPEVIKKLREIENATKDLMGYSGDNKLSHFYNNVLQDLTNYGNKIIVFTRYIDTADYLTDELKKLAKEKSLLRGFDIVEIIGTDPIHVRAEKYEIFLGSEKGILVSTDCMSEGIDLQYSSNMVVNYELTWNPNRLEQRNGRVDRFGQPKRDVYIRTLIIKESLEIAILDLLYKKIKTISGDIGYEPKCFGNLDLIGDVVDDYFKQENTIRFGKRSEEEGYLSLDFFMGREGSEDEIKKMLRDHINPNFNQILDEDSFYGQTTVDFQDVHERMKEMQKSIGDINVLLQFLQKALPFFDSSIEIINKKGYPQDKVFKITLDEIVQELIIGGDTNKTEYLITIDPIFGAKNTDIETLSLKSPIINAVISLVKERGFISDDKNFYGRSAAASTELVDEVVAIIHYKIRYLVKTREKSMMEELVPIGVRIFEDPIDKGKNPLIKLDKIEKIWKHFISGKTLNYPGLDQTVKNGMKELFKRTDFEKIIKSAINKRLVMVKQNANNLMKKLKEKNLAAAEELEGMNDISIISYDPISITVFYPGGKK